MHMCKKDLLALDNLQQLICHKTTSKYGPHVTLTRCFLISRCNVKNQFMVVHEIN